MLALFLIVLVLYILRRDGTNIVGFCGNMFTFDRINDMGPNEQKQYRRFFLVPWIFVCSRTSSRWPEPISFGHFECVCLPSKRIGFGPSSHGMRMNVEGTEEGKGGAIRKPAPSCVMCVSRIKNF